MLDETITYLFLMGLSHVEEIAKGLINAGRNINTPVAVISNGTTARQRKCVGNLGNIYTKVLLHYLIQHLDKLNLKVLQKLEFLDILY